MNNRLEDISNSIIRMLYQNKLVIVIGLIAILGSILGYNFYIESKAVKNTEAANIFAQLSSNYALEEQNEEVINSLHSKLEQDFGNTGFATLGLILKAKHFGEHQDLEKALKTYYEIIDKTDGLFGDDIFNSIARLNAAQLENSLGNFDAAIKTLQGIVNPNDPLVLEILGDSQAGSGNIDAALKSYSTAIEEEQSEEVKTMLRSKISLLNIPK